MKGINENMKTEKSPMEELKVVFTWEDAKRLLSKREFELLVGFEKNRGRGISLDPWAESRYYPLLDKLEDEKRRELVKAMFGEYEEKVKEDGLRLKELSEGIYISTKQEALEYFVRDFPNYKRLLERADPTTWLPGYLPKIRKKAEGWIEGVFDYYLMEEVENPEAFGYEKKVWPFIMLHASYVKVGLDCLEFSFTPHAVATFKVHLIAHKKTLRGWSHIYPSSDEPLHLCTERLDPGDLFTVLPKIVIPLRLLQGLALGGIQPNGCEVVKQKDGFITYRVGGFNSEVVLPHEFLMFLMELGEEPLKRLQEFGLISALTLKIIESKKDEVKPIELPVIREKDRKYLGAIHETEGFLTFGGWGEALGLTKQGADALLKRLEGEGMVSLIRHESGEGIRASLTTLGLAILRQIPEFDG